MFNVAGIISIILFYILILAVGIWAGRKKEAGNDSEEEVMLAGRNIGMFVGIFTMTGNGRKLKNLIILLKILAFGLKRRYNLYCKYHECFVRASITFPLAFVYL